MKLVFSSIINDTIFNEEFQKLTTDNGTIEFKHKHSSGGLAVVYAPNGTGKSSLAKVLKNTVSTESLSFSAVDDKGVLLSPESGCFHIIQDQLNRNIIQGKESDYLVGDQIRREYELRDQLNSLFLKAFTDLNSKYKREFKVTRVGDYLLSQMDKHASYDEAYGYIRDLVKTQSKGKNIDSDKYVSFIRNGNKTTKVVLDSDKRQFIIDDCNKGKIADCILNIRPETIMTSEQAIQIERHDDAIHLLHKYHNLDACIVCDNSDFDGNKLLKNKTDKRQNIYNSLDDMTKNLLETVVKDKSLDIVDPFEIKRIIREFISGAEPDELVKLQENLNIYIRSIVDEMVDELFHCFDGTDFYSKYDEYKALTQVDPQLDSEELQFIREIINENIGRDITI